MSVVVTCLRYVDIHVVSGILETEEKTMVSMSVPSRFGGVWIFLHELGNWSAFDATLEDIHFENKASKSLPFD